MDYTFNTEKRPQEKEIDTALLKRKRRWLNKGGLLKRNPRRFLYFLVVFIGIYIFFFSSIFLIEEIDLNRLGYVDEQSIYSEFENVRGQNFFLSDLSLFRKNILETDVFVKEVRTEKVFPRKVVVTIVEKEPFLITKSSVKGCHLLDNEGYVLSENDCEDLQNMYFVNEIEGVDIDNFEFEYAQQSSFYTVRQIYDLVSVFEYYGYSIEKLSLNNQVLKVHLTNERTVIFSLSDDLDAQLKRLIVLTHSLDSENIFFKTMDLRFQRPILTK